jgi:tetratricopeptide (TPR) repeat protein
MAVIQMQRAKMSGRRDALLSAISLLTLLSLAIQPARAQSIGEYGGVLGMPKPVPTGHVGAMQNLYGAGGLGNVTGAAGGSNLPFVGDSRVIAKNVADKANAIFNEAQKKEKAGKIGEAEALYRTSAAWRERVWGTKDPAVFVIYGKIGQLCVKQNKLPEAEAAYRRQIACAVRLYGAGAYEMCPILTNLGEACMAQGKFPDAVSTYRQLHQLKKRKLGDGNSETLGALLKLAGALKQGGNVKEAEAMAKEGATLAQSSPENALLVQAFNEVINPPAPGTAPAMPAAEPSTAITPAGQPPAATPAQTQIGGPAATDSAKTVEKSDQSADAQKEVKTAK